MANFAPVAGEESYLLHKTGKEGVKMKKLAFLGLVAFLVLSGGILGEQPTENEKNPSMNEMMQQMMGREKSGMAGMMRMMGQMGKMVDQCASMMESRHSGSGQTKESRKQQGCQELK